MTDRDDFERRCQQAMFRAMAIAAEKQGEQPQPTDEQPAAPNLAQIMGVRVHADLEAYASEDDKLRRFAGLR